MKKLRERKIFSYLTLNTLFQEIKCFNLTKKK